MSDRESDVREAAAKSISILICFCTDCDKIASLVDASLGIIIDERICIDTGLLLISLLTNISFQLDSENMLVHKLLKALELEHDNKRLIR